MDKFVEKTFDTELNEIDELLDEIIADEETEESVEQEEPAIFYKNTNTEDESLSAESQYFREVGREPILTREEEINLFHRMKEGDMEARNEIIRRNLKLVITIATKYKNKGLPFLDLVEEGNLGLMKAVEKFDIDRGYHLSTYSTWWIRQAITRALADTGRTIRLPVHLYEVFRKVEAARNALTQENFTEPTISEITEYTGLPRKKVELAIINFQETGSLEKPISEKDDTTLKEVVTDSASQYPGERLEQQELKEALHKAMQYLNQREQQVIRYRVGLDGCTKRTLEDLGRMYGVSRERVRQIEARALRILKEPMIRLYFGDQAYA